jgi:hypothetical protein
MEWLDLDRVWRERRLMGNFKTAFASGGGFGQYSGSEFPGYRRGMRHVVTADAHRMPSGAINISMAVNVAYYVAIELFEDMLADALSFITTTATLNVKFSRYDIRTGTRIADLGELISTVAGLKDLTFSTPVLFPKGMHVIGFMPSVGHNMRAARIGATDPMVSTSFYPFASNIQALATSQRPEVAGDSRLYYGQSGGSYAAGLPAIMPTTFDTAVANGVEIPLLFLRPYTPPLVP